MGSFHVVGFAQEDAGFIKCLWVHSNSPWVSLGSSGVVGFTRVRPGVRWVHLQSFGSLAFALEVVGFTRRRPEGRWVHAGGWVHSGSPWGSFGSFGVVEFTRIRI